MGDASIIRQGPTEARYTTDLDHSGKLRVQVFQRALQDFAMARIRGSFELLEHMLAGQQQALALALAGDLGGSQRRLRWTGRRHCFCLLLLDRFALPSSRHAGIIPARTIVAGSLLMRRNSSPDEFSAALGDISKHEDSAGRFDQSAPV